MPLRHPGRAFTATLHSIFPPVHLDQKKGGAINNEAHSLAEWKENIGEKNEIHIIICYQVEGVRGECGRETIRRSWFRNASVLTGAEFAEKNSNLAMREGEPKDTRGSHDRQPGYCVPGPIKRCTGIYTKLSSAKKGNGALRNSRRKAALAVLRNRKLWLQTYRREKVPPQLRVACRPADGVNLSPELLSIVLREK